MKIIVQFKDVTSTLPRKCYNYLSNSEVGSYVVKSISLENELLLLTHLVSLYNISVRIYDFLVN